MGRTAGTFASARKNARLKVQYFQGSPVVAGVFPGVSGGGRESPKDGPGKDTKSFNIYV